MRKRVNRRYKGLTRTGSVSDLGPFGPTLHREYHMTRLLTRLMLRSLTYKAGYKRDFVHTTRPSTEVHLIYQLEVVTSPYVHSANTTHATSYTEAQIAKV